MVILQSKREPCWKNLLQDGLKIRKISLDVKQKIAKNTTLKGLQEGQYGWWDVHEKMLYFEKNL
jgi:hypothetical protein